MAMSAETSWMGKYRDFVESIIYLCNRSATRFNMPQYYNTSFRLTAIQIQIIEYTLPPTSAASAVMTVCRSMSVGCCISAMSP